MKEMEEINTREIEEIMKRASLASPGPWKAYLEGRDHEGGSDFIMIGEGSNRADDFEISGAKRADYDFGKYEDKILEEMLDSEQIKVKIWGEEEKVIDISKS